MVIKTPRYLAVSLGSMVSTTHCIRCAATTHAFSSGWCAGFGTWTDGTLSTIPDSSWCHTCGMWEWIPFQFPCVMMECVVLDFCLNGRRWLYASTALCSDMPEMTHSVWSKCHCSWQTDDVCSIHRGFSGSLCSFVQHIDKHTLAINQA